MIEGVEDKTKLSVITGKCLCPSQEGANVPRDAGCRSLYLPHVLLNSWALCTADAMVSCL